MTVNTRGFTYYKEENYTEETWESNFSELKVTLFHHVYAVGSKTESFIYFGNDAGCYLHLEHALNKVRIMAINEFFGDDIF